MMRKILLTIILMITMAINVNADNNIPTIIDLIEQRTMADYTKLIPIIKKFEGGYSNNPYDKGGATNSGVTLSTYRYYFGRNKTAKDLKNMTEEEWSYIFKTGYWDKWQGDSIDNQSLANFVVDWLWHSGVYGIKYVQEVLGVAKDGKVGPKTLAALNGHDNQRELFGKIWARRKKQLDDIVKRNPKQKVFYRGWMARIQAFQYYN